MTITSSENYYEQNSAPVSDFSTYGYQVVQELGHNNVGSRTTYLATQIATGQAVVIKQFSFGRPGANWSGFKAYEREIQVLRSLSHAGIPRYLDCFETSNSFCLLQEYKDAQPLSVPRSFSQDEIKQIAGSLLEILVYLQSLVPPVIHRDIKPDNVLVDQQLNVYLVDFGFARIGGSELAMSSVVVGTTGFMPPEQLLNQDLSAATDLYSLGATLICLLSGIQSASLNKFIDETYIINTEKLLHTSVDARFKQWLKKLVSPRHSDRYNNAHTALAGLEAIDQPLGSADVAEMAAIWEEKGQKSAVAHVNNLGLALAETAVVVVPLGVCYLLPIFFQVSALSSANEPIVQPIIQSIKWMIEINSQLIYLSWRLGVAGLIAKTLWELWTKKGNWKLSAIKTVIFGSSMLFFQYLAILLQQLR